MPATTHNIWCDSCDELTRLTVEDLKPGTMACEHCGALLRQRDVVRAQQTHHHVSGSAFHQAMVDEVERARERIAEELLWGPRGKAAVLADPPVRGGVNYYGLDVVTVPPNHLGGLTLEDINRLARETLGDRGSEEERRIIDYLKGTS